MGFLVNALKYAEAAYKEPQDFPDFVPSNIREDFKPLQSDLDFAFICEEKDVIKFVFRGTDTEGGNYKAWLSNLRGVDRVKEHPRYKFHDGFMDYFHSFKMILVQRAIEATRQGKRIELYGHSRGGPPAIVTAWTLWEDYKIQSSVVTAGAPRVGGKKFREAVARSPIWYSRIETKFDLVPKAVPKTLGYRHCGELIRLSMPWYYRFFPVTAHKIKTYIKLLNKMGA